jgi:hypothetical protein
MEDKDKPRQTRIDQTRPKKPRQTGRNGPGSGQDPDQTRPEEARPTCGDKARTRHKARQEKAREGIRQEKTSYDQTDTTNKRRTRNADKRQKTRGGRVG